MSKNFRGLAAPVLVGHVDVQLLHRGVGFLHPVGEPLFGGSIQPQVEGFDQFGLGVFIHRPELFQHLLQAGLDDAGLSGGPVVAVQQVSGGFGVVGVHGLFPLSFLSDTIISDKPGFVKHFF